jgi:hypothetical protein
MTTCAQHEADLQVALARVRQLEQSLRDAASSLERAADDLVSEGADSSAAAASSAAWRAKEIAAGREAP